MKTVGFKGYSVFLMSCCPVLILTGAIALSCQSVNLNSKGAKGHGVQYFKTAFKTKISVKLRPDLPEYIKNHLKYKSTDSKSSSSSWFSNFILCYLYNMGMLKHEIFTTLFSSNLSYLIIECY